MGISRLHAAGFRALLLVFTALPVVAFADGIVKPEASPVAPAPSAQPTAAAPAAPALPAAPLLEHAAGERVSKAMGHFSRAHSLLISAIQEFDLGYQLADPSSLMDVSQFRGDLTDRAADLEHLLDPQPRISKGGVRYEGDPRLLNTEKK